MQQNVTPWSTCPLETGVFTIDDLEVILGRGMHYELIDGMLVVSKDSPQLQQVAVVEIAHLLRTNRAPDYHVLLRPLSFQPSPRISLEPDVMVEWRPSQKGQSTQQVVLVVELVSRSSRIFDRLVKRSIYEQAGVTAYWIFDPELEELTVLELVNGRYVERAVVKGTDGFDAELPFVVRIVPAELVD
jgi:Uma2 family endonuclease